MTSTATATLPATHSIPATPRGGTGRYEIYTLIHKGLRLFMSDVLVTVGRTDAAKELEVASTVRLVRELLDMCRVHLHSENQFIHAAMEARRPGSACATASEHANQEALFEMIEADLFAVETSAAAARASLLFTLYNRLAVFVAENFDHMNEEETYNQAVLWDTHSDDELRAIEAAIVASHPPAVNAVALRWMVPAMTPAERAGFLAAVRRTMPAEAFGGLVALAVNHLSAADGEQLRALFGLSGS
jgi:hypothetical protein